MIATEQAELAAGNEAIRGRGLRKHYGGVVAVAGVDLSVPTGGVHGLVGPNGAGKTTLLGMVLGLVEPDGGDLHIFGRDRSAVERGWLQGVAGFIGTPTFYPYLSGRRNLEYLARLDAGGARGRVEEVLAATGLAGVAAAKVRGYSMGMGQRLGLAAALLRAPRLLILDEPANGLDPAGARDLRGLLGELAAAGTAVLLSSHDMAAIEDVCDGLTVLRAGRTVFRGSLAEMRAAAPDAGYRLHTGDDDAATALGRGVGGVAVTGLVDGGLGVQAGEEDLDRFMIALGRAGIAVRRLACEGSPLESLYFQLIADAAGPPRPVGRPVAVPTGSRC